MLKSEAEHIVRRAIEEAGAKFSEQQIQALAMMSLKIAERIVEEAFAATKHVAGSPGTFFTS